LPVLFVLEQAGAVVATTYLNVIPNLTRAARPYAVVENVVVEDHFGRWTIHPRSESSAAPVR